jgi:predicted transcriptional regulator
MSLDFPIDEYIDRTLNIISDNATIAEAGRKMRELGVDSILTTENSQILGIVTMDDIMKAIFKDLDTSILLKEIVSKPIISIDKTAKVGDALRIMSENKIRRLLVTENSSPIGLITQKKIFGNIASKAFAIPELELPKKIRCPYCPSVFQTKSDLSQHIDQIHIGYGVFQGNFSKVEDLGSVSSAEHFPKTI